MRDECYARSSQTVRPNTPNDQRSAKKKIFLRYSEQRQPLGTPTVADAHMWDATSHMGGGDEAAALTIRCARLQICC